MELNKPLIREDLSILIDGERGEEAMKAVEDGHLHETHSELMKRSRQVHLELAKRFDWTVVPLQEGIEETNDLLWALVESKISG